MDCLFCAIAQKKIPAEIIYADDSTLAFLDIHPRALGHTLVIPRDHSKTILDTAPQTLQTLALTIQKVTGILHTSLSPAGFTIGINHGEQAGQAVSHLHAHIIPRFQGDGGGNIHSVVSNPPTESVTVTAKRLRQKNV